MSAKRTFTIVLLMRTALILPNLTPVNVVMILWMNRQDVRHIQVVFACQH